MTKVDCQSQSIVHLTPSRATYLDLHDETLVYFFRLVAVFERIVQIIRLFE